MSESMTLELPADLARRARDLAAATNRTAEDVVVEWIERIAAEPVVDQLSDAEILEFCQSRMSDDEQTAMSDLLGRQATLSSADKRRLDGLLAIYRRGLVLKARATKEAVARGLIPRLNGDAA